MKVLITASECSPLVKVGGIADVIGSLPIALKKLCVDVRLAIPYYKPLKDFIEENKMEDKVKSVLECMIKYGDEELEVTIYETTIPNSDIPVYLIYCDKYISNGGIYFSPEIMPSPEDELERFAVFSKVVAVVFGSENDFFNPEVIHCNDWHTGMVPQILQNTLRYNPKATMKKTLFTIHNLAYQGFSKLEVVEKLGININLDQSLKWDAEDNNLDFLLQGIVGANYITTVSPKYAEEIQTTEFGEGLEEILKARQSRVVGILNGISYEVFNPATDKLLLNNYGLSNWQTNKSLNKKALQEELGLEVNDSIPMIGIVSRLAHQKGIDVISEMLEEILKLGYQVVILGTGDPMLETKLKEVAELPQYKSRYKAILQFSEQFARRIYASSDFFMVPSRFEPCGLTQMIAMKYGSLPIVRATGGLYDTVEDERTGFTFSYLNYDEVLKCLKRALNVYANNKPHFRKMVESAMKKDFSWEESAKKYVYLYYKTLNDE